MSIKGEINLGLGELLGESNVALASSEESLAPNQEEPATSEPASASISPSVEQNILEEVIAAKSPATEPKTPPPGQGVVGQYRGGQRKRLKRRRYGVLLGALAGAIVAFSALQWWRTDNSGFVAEPLPAQKSPEQLVPAILPVDTGVLGGLIADLEGPAPASLAQPRELPNPPQVVQRPPEPPTAKIPAGVQIDLRGPRESSEIREARASYHRNGGSEYPPGQQDGPSPFGREKLPPYGGTKGKVILGGETYRMLKQTTVFSEPDDRAAEVAELFTGDKVLAEERYGKWLKIRSLKGREGYIPSKNAEKLREFYERVPWEDPSGTFGR